MFQNDKAANLGELMDVRPWAYDLWSHRVGDETKKQTNWKLKYYLESFSDASSFATDNWCMGSIEEIIESHPGNKLYI
jgi:hypothetical protein